MKTCQFCDKPLFEPDADGYRTQRIDSLFCSEACRTDWHNRQKKINRAKSRAIAAIETLQEIGTSEAREAIRQIAEKSRVLVE